MPVHENAIANGPDPTAATISARFDDLNGTIITRSQQLEVLNRAGVDGSGFRRLGQRGRPFELVSLVYGPNFAWVKTAEAYYKAMVGLDPLYVIKQSVNWGTYVVLGVDVVEAEAVSSVCGNALGYLLYPTLEVRVVARWQLHG